MTAHRCPECAGGRRRDGGPGCDCAARAIAAAEDFDPLRIRPYVTLHEPTTDLVLGRERGRARAPGAPDGGTARPEPESPPPGLTPIRPAAPDRALGSDGPGTYATGPGGSSGPGDHGGREKHRAVDDGAGPDLGLLRHDSGPGNGDGDGDGPGPGDDGPLVRHRRPRRHLAAIAGTAVAVVAVCGGVLGSGLLGGTDDDLAEREKRTGGPSAVLPTGDGEGTPSASAPASSPGPSSASASSSANAGRSRGASRPPAVDPAATFASGTLTASPGTSGASGGGSGGQGPAPGPGTKPPESDEPPVLEKGMKGAQVVELQKRLRQTPYYRGDTDGTYDEEVRQAVRAYQIMNGVQGDPAGVYGPNTRKALEAETTEP